MERIEIQHKVTGRIIRVADGSPLTRHMLGNGWERFELPSSVAAIAPDEPAITLSAPPKSGPEPDPTPPTPRKRTRKDTP